MNPAIWPLVRLASVVGLVSIPGYAVACLIWPYTACRRCEGAGKFRTSSGKAWRKCPRCKGSGERLRLGRKILNRYRRRT